MPLLHRLVIVSAVLVAFTHGQTSRPGTPAADPSIAAIVKSISAERIEADDRKLVSFGTRHSLSVSTDETRGAPAAARWILSEFEKSAASSNGRMTAALEPFEIRSIAQTARVLGYDPKEESIPNVVAKLSGSEKGRLIIVSGHYDSRNSDRLDVEKDAPGANDDASGTAAVMELARAMAGIETRSTIWFVAFTAEEQGLWGSTAMARACDEAGLEIEAMVTNDIIGGARKKDGSRGEQVLRIFSEGRPQLFEKANARVRRFAAWTSEGDSPSREIARFARRAAERYVPSLGIRLIHRQDRFLRGGDHRPFNLLGYGAVRFTEPLENYDWQHQDVREENGIAYGDLPEHVDFDYVADVARVNAALILSIATAPASPKRVVIDASKLMNETRLRWEKASDETIVGYRVLMRRTDEADWTVERDVGLVRDVTVPESKDDWLFAVQAIDEQGRASLPAFAEAQTPPR